MLQAANQQQEFLDNPAQWPQAPIVTLAEAFADDRGVIQPLVDLPMRSALLIRTRPGGIRANHYHKTDWHFIWVVSGQFEYHFRPVGAKTKPEMIVVKPGQLLWTPPMLEHAMLYTEDCDIIVFCRNGRSQEEYERDVVRVKLL